MKAFVIGRLETFTNILFWVIPIFSTVSGFQSGFFGGLLGLVTGLIFAVFATGSIYLLLSINEHLHVLRAASGSGRAGSSSPNSGRSNVEDSVRGEGEGRYRFRFAYKNKTVEHDDTVFVVGDREFSSADEAKAYIDSLDEGK